MQSKQIAVAVTALVMSAAAMAQDAFPSRPVVMVVPFGPGGAIDGEARLYTAAMSKIMGQQFVLDYKEGAGGTLGNAYAAKAKPDGYTLLVANGSYTVYPAVYKNLPFDTLKDFAPVSLLSERVSVLVANAKFPANNLREYLDYARNNPEKINYGTSGAGSISHLSAAWLHNLTNTKVTYVHYKGAAQQLTDLTAGRIEVAAGNLLPQLPLIKAGKLKPVAILTNKRAKPLPDVQAAVELVPGFSYTNWLGIVAPAATPKPVIAKLNEGFVKMMAQPEIVAALDKDGLGAVGSTPEEFGKRLVMEVAVWKKVVADNGIKLED